MTDGVFYPCPCCSLGGMDTMPCPARQEIMKAEAEVARLRAQVEVMREGLVHARWTITRHITWPDNGPLKALIQSGLDAVEGALATISARNGGADE